MKTYYNFNKEQLEFIKKSIQNSLLKLGIITKVSIQQEEGRLKITSTDFQTVPVLFERLNLNFEIGEIGKIEDTKFNLITIALRVTYHYFDGGGNSHTLGWMSFIFNDKSIKIRKNIEL